MMKVKINWKLGLLCEAVSHVVNAKEKFLKEIKSYPSEHMNDTALLLIQRKF